MHSQIEFANVLPPWWPMSQAAADNMLRLLVATALGGVIGLERELKHRPAGLRTNILICFGSAMFTLLSQRLALSFSGDQTRIAAQVIPGIGFIGAGAILKEKGSVSGLTSAATIFVTSGIGMAAGGGFFQTAAFATGLVMFSLILLGAIEQRFDLKQVVMGYDVVATGCETPDALIGELNRILDEEGMTMRTVRFSQTNGTSCHVQFSSEGYRSQHRVLSTKLKLSPRTATVASVLESERD